MPRTRTRGTSVRRPAQPKEDETSLPASWASGAGAFWSRWWGNPQLVNRVARAAQEALTVTDKPPPSVDIVIYVAQDAERFDSTDAYRDNVTDDALNHWHRLEVVVSAEEVEIKALFTRQRFRGRTKRDYDGTTGIMLTVLLFTEKHDRGTAEEFRDRVVPAIDRGRPAAAIEPFLHSWGRETPFPIQPGLDMLSTWTWGATATATLIIVVFFSAGHVPVALSVLIAFSMAAASGWIAAFIDHYLVGRVVVTRTRRLGPRLLLLGSVILTASVSATVGVIVKSLIS